MGKISLNLSKTPTTSEKDKLTIDASTIPTTLDPSNFLNCQVWKWNPMAGNKSDGFDHSQPNPQNLTPGRIWLSVMITDEDEFKFYEENGWEYEYGGDLNGGS